MRFVTRTWATAVISLLCAIVLFASVDRVPDPPAVKPQHLAARVPSLDVSVLAASVPVHFGGLRASTPPVPLFVLEQASKAAMPGYNVPLMRQAADPSPPFGSR